MKKILAISLTILVLMLCIFAVASCKKDSDGDGDGDMLYTSDTSLGTGETTFTLIVEHSTGEKINFTISTSEAILSNALTCVGILQGHDSTYGLYIDTVNGVTHDFNTDGYYWAIYEGEEYAQTGIDGITIVNGATYKLVASK
jgi:hypothetical protein